MLTTYGILGTGSTKKNVIEDALNELGEDNEFFVYGVHKLSASEGRVHDWLTDHEVPYTVVHNTETSTALMENALHFVSNKSLNVEFFLKELKKRKGVLLLLWDEENNEEMENIVFTATDLGIEIKDLTNGLVPIVVETNVTEVKEKVQKEEVEIEPFTKKELQDMPISVLKKSAKNQNIDASYMSKEQIINHLLGDIPEVPEVKSVSTTPYPVRESIQTSDEKECMITVVMPNGTVVSTPATMAEVRLILGLS
jgi:hypothetical protein